MNDYNTATQEDLVTIRLTLLPRQIPLVYAVLAQGVALGAVAQAYKPNTGERPETVVTGNVGNASPTLTSSPASSDSIPETPSAPETIENDGEVDADGHPWSEELHASTRSKTKTGHWRMKVGVSRPDPMPGFPKDETPSETSTPSPVKTAADGATAQAGSTQIEEPASVDASQDEDDEFAAFRAAAAKADAEDETAKANVPARKWTDADLGALCNQAAVKLGDPAPVKAAIAQFVPEGEVAHSRNVPADKRAEFVAAVEKAAGIEFAG